MALRGEVLISVAGLSLTDGPRKNNSLVVAVPCREQMQHSIAINGMLRKRSIHRRKFHSTSIGDMEHGRNAHKASFKPAYIEEYLDPTHLFGPTKLRAQYIYFGPLNLGPNTFIWAH